MQTKLVALLLLTPALLVSGDYAASVVTVDAESVVRLTDSANQVQVSVAPHCGNVAYEMRVKGTNILNFPFESLAEWRKSRRMVGVPFLAPWANRIDRGYYFVDGNKYVLNDDLGNFIRDGNKLPMHGLLQFSDKWEVVNVSAGDDSAWVTSRLEFGRYPELMAQFPFAHTIEMTYRLANGSLEVETVLRNHAAERMPVAIGFHPYFRVTDAPRTEWIVRIGARKHAIRTEQVLPTGELEPLPWPNPLTLSPDVRLDDAFVDLVRDNKGRAEFSLSGKQQKVTVLLGPNYPVVLVFAPGRGNTVAIEPMASMINAFNLEHEGKYSELQWVAPGEEWRESFWVVPSGF